MRPTDASSADPLFGGKIPTPDSDEGRALLARLAPRAPAPPERPLRSMAEVAAGVSTRLGALRASAGAAERAFRERGGRCWDCGDTGLFGKVAGREDRFCACETGRAKAGEDRLRSVVPLIAAAGVGEAKFAGASLATWPAGREFADIIASLDSWERTWPEGGHFLVLAGDRGRGKTTLAAVLLRRAIARTGKAGWRCKATDLLLAPYEEVQVAVARARSVPLLVLDDVGERQPRNLDYAQSVLFSILDERSERRAWTIATTNLDPLLAEGEPNSLAGYLGGRVYDRVDELTRYWIDLSDVPNLRAVGAP